MFTTLPIRTLELVIGCDISILIVTVGLQLSKCQYYFYYSICLPISISMFIFHCNAFFMLVTYKLA